MVVPVPVIIFPIYRTCACLWPSTRLVVPGTPTNLQLETPGKQIKFVILVTRAEWLNFLPKSAIYSHFYLHVF
jgi:hypothetical protein